MAVPDWPGTYGYNLFLYPWSTWFFGPWDLFVEHGHRLFASGVGLLTIGLVVIVFRTDQRVWLRWLAIAALGLVISQGVLGGMRVVLNARALAFVHGCTGPAFFALTAAIVTATGRRSPDRPTGSRWWCLLPLLVYNQVALGAAIRHVPEGGSFVTFAQHTMGHVIGAAAVLVAVLGVIAFALARPVGRVRRALTWVMALALMAQLALGVATWVTKYRLPDWAQTGVVSEAWETWVGPGTMDPPIAGGWEETHIVTAHSAIGSLLLALATAYAVASWPRRESTSESTNLT